VVANLRNSDGLENSFGERTRPRVRGSAPSLNPLPDVSDEGVADGAQGAQSINSVKARLEDMELWKRLAPL